MRAISPQVRAIATLALWASGARLADRLRQCRQSVSSEGDRAAPRDCDPSRDGCGTLASRAATADRKHGVGTHSLERWRWLLTFWTAGSPWRRDSCERAAAHHAGLHARSPRARLGDSRCRSPRASSSGCAPAWQAVRIESHPVAQARRERQQPGRAAADAAQCARRRRSCPSPWSCSSRAACSCAASPTRARRSVRASLTDRLLSMRLDPGLVGYKAPRIEALYRDILTQAEGSAADRIRVPGELGRRLAAAAAPSAFVVPDGTAVARPGGDVEVGASVYNAGPHYFETMGISTRRGPRLRRRATP